VQLPTVSPRVNFWNAGAGGAAVRIAVQSGRGLTPLVSRPKTHPEGLEPPTLGSEDRCSIQLSYGCRQVWLLTSRGLPIVASSKTDYRRCWRLRKHLGAWIAANNFGATDAVDHLAATMRSVTVVFGAGSTPYPPALNPTTIWPEERLTESASIFAVITNVSLFPAGRLPWEWS
jgi:hypothetical protein